MTPDTFLVDADNIAQRRTLFWASARLAAIFFHGGFPFRPGGLLGREPLKTESGDRQPHFRICERNPTLSRYFLILGWGLGLIPVAGLLTAALWTVATLTAAHCRTLTERWLFTRAGDERPDPTRDRRFLAVGFTTTCFWAAAPLLAWHSGHPAAHTVAVLYVAAGFALVAAQFRGAPGIVVAISAPYALTAMYFVVETVLRGGDLATLCAFLVMGGAVATQVFFAASVEQRVEKAHADNLALVEQLRLALDSMHAATWDLDFRSQTFRTGGGMDRLYGRALSWDDVTTPGTPLVHPDDSDGVASSILCMTQDSPRAVNDHRIIRADGEIVWLRTAAIASFNDRRRLVRLSGLTHDITAEKHLEIQLLEATRAAEAALEEKRQVFAAYADEALAPQSPIIDENRQGEDFVLAGSVARLRAVVSEIAARDVALLRIIDDLDKARAAAESANLAKSQFLANMSHELRTPLNAITGYSEILLEQAQARGDESDDKDLRRILSAAHHLLHLVNDVLDLSKIEAGRMDVSPAPFSVDLMLQDIAGTVEPMAAANRNTVRIDMDVGLGDAFTDRFKLSQCVLNLTSNAVKFTRGGNVRLSVFREQRAGVGWIVINVADDGVGIAPEKLQRLFQPFVQADASVTRAFGGTGLGLAITRHLARLLGGDVTVESTPGRGSTFSLGVPATYRAPQFEAAA